jgi:hypothetical protein
MIKQGKTQTEVAAIDNVPRRETITHTQGDWCFKTMFFLSYPGSMAESQYLQQIVLHSKHRPVSRLSGVLSEG